jgi:ABC-type glutathione transport system ATPase component
MHAKTVFDVRHVSKVYQKSSFLGTQQKAIFALRNFSFRFLEGKTYGIVGESGSGKSTLARLLTKLEEPCSGRIFFESHFLERFRSKDLQQFRKRVQMVFQNPARSLDPRWKIKSIISEPLSSTKGSEKLKRILNALKEVDLPESYLSRFAHELSGGEQQRVAIARALVGDPHVLILDEPLSYLDVLVQKQILELLKKLRRHRKMTILFITHDLAVAREFCDELIVLQNGIFVESGATQHIFEAPKQAFTQKLLRAIPV